MLYLLLVVSIFVAAYGNAMKKKVYRRKALVLASGQTVPEISKGYDRTGTVVFTVGVVTMAGCLVDLVAGDLLAHALSR